MKRKISLLLILLLLFTVIPPESVEAATLKISSSSAVVPLGMYKKLSVSGTCSTVSWSSSNKTVATVSSSGTVTAKKCGVAMISAKVSGKVLKCKITVISRYNPRQVGNVTLAVVRKYYKTAQLVDYIRDGNSIEILISRPQGDGASGRIVTVNIPTGKATWESEWDDFFSRMPRTFTVWSCKAIRKVTKVTLSKSSASVVKGKTLTLKAGITPSDATNKGVTWSSSNQKVATVTSKGVVKGIAAGTATITAKARDGSGKKATCRVTVKSAAAVVPNVTDTVLRKKAANAAKYLGLTQKTSYRDPEFGTYYYYIRKGRKLFDGSPYLEYYPLRLEGGHWNLCIEDKTIAFQGIRVGMAESKAKAALAKQKWTLEFSEPYYKDSNATEFFYSRTLPTEWGREAFLEVIVKKGSVKSIIFSTDGD